MSVLFLLLSVYTCTYVCVPYVVMENLCLYFICFVFVFLKKGRRFNLLPENFRRKDLKRRGGKWGERRREIWCHQKHELSRVSSLIPTHENLVKWHQSWLLWLRTLTFYLRQPKIWCFIRFILNVISRVQQVQGWWVLTLFSVDETCWKEQLGWTLKPSERITCNLKFPSTLVGEAQARS